MPLYSNQTERIHIESGNAGTFHVSHDPHLIHFVNCVSYDSKRDDDMSFSIMPFRNSGELVDSGKNGETYYEAEVRRSERAFVEFNLTAIELQKDVQVRRSIFSMKGRQQFHRGIAEFLVEEGFEGILVIELLRYESGTDDDFMFGIFTVGVGNTLSLIAFTDFGQSNSEITLRVTFLQWPAVRNYVVTGGLITADNNTTARFQIPRGHDSWVFTPAAYVTDSTKFPRATFESGGILEESILSNLSRAGRVPVDPANLWGFARNTGIAAGSAALQEYVVAITAAVEAIESLVTALKRIRGDRRDDDFSWTLRAVDFDGLPQASLETKYGNRFCYASARLVCFQFPDMESQVDILI